MSTYIQNRKAQFEFEFLETFEAGLVLQGFEVKAVRAGKGRLEGAFVIIRGGEAFLVNAKISPFQPANTPKSYDPERPRKLLFSKKELARLEKRLNTENLTIIPLQLYNAGRNIKLKVALARRKQKHDKRESIKDRDNKRDIRRTLKNQ